MTGGCDTVAHMNIPTLDSGSTSPEYNKGWALAESCLRTGHAANAAAPEEITTSDAAEGYFDRMGIHTFNEMEAIS